MNLVSDVYKGGHRQPQPEKIERLLEDLNVNITRLASSKFGRTRRGRFFVQQFRASVNRLRTAYDAQEPLIHHIKRIYSIAEWKNRDLATRGPNKLLEEHMIADTVTAKIMPAGQRRVICELVAHNPKDATDVWLIANSGELFEVEDARKWLKNYVQQFEMQKAHMKQKGGPTITLHPPQTFWPKPNPVKSLKRTPRGRIVGRCSTCESTQHMRATQNAEIWKCGKCGWIWRSGLQAAA